MHYNLEYIENNRAVATDHIPGISLETACDLAREAVESGLATRVNIMTASGHLVRRYPRILRRA